MPDRQQHTDDGPRGPGLRGLAPSGKGKEKVPVLEHRQKGNAGAAPAEGRGEAQGPTPAQSSQAGGSKSRRLQRGDGSLVEEPAPKRQKTAGAEEQSGAAPPPPQHRPLPRQQTPPPPPPEQRPAMPPPPPVAKPQSPSPPPEASMGGDPHQGSGGSSTGRKLPRAARCRWEWYDYA
ncbi:basic salivary proline-rich protein 3-like [Panicum hallii]|uniref:basic salivary proline-rich protein 3-like n=1 Tax=Panicum hallii TaxID=206008 RepID=UPI000DF4E533|nr:basic salivary proline-rich protein 3-like [Panicum hallii]